MTRALLFCALFAAFTGGCAVTNPTEIVVVVRTDFRDPPLGSVAITVLPGTGQAGATPITTCTCTGEGDTCVSFPLTLGLTPESSADDVFTVTASGFLDANCSTLSTVEQSAVVAFIATETLSLDLDLLKSCSNVTCLEGTTCVDSTGQCVSNDRQGKLPVFTDYEGFTPLDLAFPADGMQFDLGVGDGEATDAAFDAGPPAIITSIVPSSGPNTGGTTITLSGSGFIAPVTVRVDGIKATSTTWVSAMRVDVTVPPEQGACKRVDVALTNGDGQVTTATGGFTYVCGPNLLNLGATFMTTLAAPQSIAAADLNGDHLIDLLTADSSSPKLAVLLNKGGGAFAAPATTATGSAGSAIGVGDFNEDGFTDVALAQPSAQSVSLFAGNGKGALAAPVVTANLAANPTTLVVANFDNDPHLDIALASSPGNLASILFGFGNLKLKPPLTAPTGVNPIAIAAANLDKNALPDLVIANHDAQTLTVLLNPGGVLAASTIALPDHPTGIAIGSLGDESLAYVFVATGDEATVLKLAPNGDGTFQQPLKISAVTASSIALTDVDGDGLPDLVLIDTATNLLAILINHNKGQFNAPIELPCGQNPSRFTVLDIDNDGRPDFAVLSAMNGTISLLQNNSP